MTIAQAIRLMDALEEKLRVLTVQRNVLAQAIEVIRPIIVGKIGQRRPRRTSPA